MKSRIMMALVMLIAVQAWALNIGDSIPMADTKMQNATPTKDVGAGDKELSIGEVKGEKGTLVIFSCNHCPFVIAWEQRIAALGNEYRQKGIGVIQINSNDPKVGGDTFEAMQKRAQERGFEFPYVVDATSEVARAFGASRTPEAFLFDAAGKLAYHGTIDDNHAGADKVQERYLKDALDALAAGKQIAVKETKAVGCSIKFRPKG